MLRTLEVPMNNASGWSRTDVLATFATASVLGVLGVSLALAEPSGRTERLLESLSNLRAIGAAMSEYRADNDGYLPFEYLSGNRRPPANRADGWCNWQFGGKNNNAYWASNRNRLFDVEAADRPLNSYLYPEYVFFAPPPPAPLPVNDPARLNDQARVFRDPADFNGFERNWPNRNNPPISSYDDVGTSYLMNMQWWDQLGGISGFLQRYNSGTARLASDQGVDPARFIHIHDSPAPTVVYNHRVNAQITTNHGTFNQGVSLFADAHARLVTYRPGLVRESFRNPDYSMHFEDLGRPAARTPGPSRPR
jgi:type II secretory pathway pseudopilin PulG